MRQSSGMINDSQSSTNGCLATCLKCGRINKINNRSAKAGIVIHIVPQNSILLCQFCGSNLSLNKDRSHGSYYFLPILIFFLTIIILNLYSEAVLKSEFLYLFLILILSLCLFLSYRTRLKNEKLIKSRLKRMLTNKSSIKDNLN